MKRLVVGAALVALGAAGPVWAADPAPSSKSPWYSRMLSAPEPVPPPRPAKRDPAAEAAAVRAGAETELMRRLAVCDQLRQIAYENNDTNLDGRVFDLEEKSWELYRRKTAHLPCNRLMPSDIEQGIGSRLIGTPTPIDSADGLEPARTTQTSRKAQASIIREVKP